MAEATVKLGLKFLGLPPEGDGDFRTAMPAFDFTAMALRAGTWAASGAAARSRVPLVYLDL